MLSQVYRIVNKFLPIPQKKFTISIYSKTKAKNLNGSTPKANQTTKKLPIHRQLWYGVGEI